MKIKNLSSEAHSFNEHFNSVGLPPEFSEVSSESLRSIIAFCVLFLVASVGNICVAISVCGRRKTPMNRLLLHLCIADLLVVFVIIPVEIFWRLTIGWHGGNWLCKGIQALRAFGLYLSSLVLVCISVDRYYIVVHPLKAIDSGSRVRSMLLASWVFALICALPQCYVFRVVSHPRYSEFQQCTTMWLDEGAEIVNTAFSLGVMYFLPLIVILFSYINILITVHKESSQGSRDSTGDFAFLRSSSRSVLERAKIRTLYLTLVIVIAFLICWTPYVVISVWHMVDRVSAQKLDVTLQDGLFTMAVANSVLNPIVYGIFSRRTSSRETRTSIQLQNVVVRTKKQQPQTF